MRYDTMPLRFATMKLGLGAPLSRPCVLETASISPQRFLQIAVRSRWMRNAKDRREEMNQSRVMIVAQHGQDLQRLKQQNQGQEARGQDISPALAMLLPRSGLVGGGFQSLGLLGIFSDVSAAEASANPGSQSSMSVSMSHAASSGTLGINGALRLTKEPSILARGDERMCCDPVWEIMENQEAGGAMIGEPENQTGAVENESEHEEPAHCLHLRRPGPP
ncbi:hypothetical protein CSOJ01_01413 [Colletotrichum sojae]|uniref:Uncharacterized protein n=1 Tax=Colletotrichum sojae TaxID=2175907 RepID=A0A8H6JVB1_9PEZI|nr:hypothetical protein CSOJ01_01413 [Colletotrichum sojae]